MTYSDALDQLYALQFHGIKLGLENTRAFLDHCGIDPAAIPAIHLAGTNGKGSTAKFCHDALARHNFRVGLFTSPHISDFRERIRINDELIDPEFIRSFVETHQDTMHHMQLTFFEVNTVLALAYFNDRNVDWIVLETGMGGRLDATNVIQPNVSVITPISEDHQYYLGHDVKDIVREKCGIIKPEVPVIVSDPLPDHRRIIKSYASNRECDVTVVDLLPVNPLSGKMRMLGAHQELNAMTAYTTVQIALGASFDADRAVQALRACIWPGRIEVVQAEPPVILDVSHNPDGVRVTLKTIAEQYPDTDFVIIFALAPDKAVDTVIQRLKRFGEALYIFPLDHDRIPPDSLEKMSEKHQIPMLPFEDLLSIHHVYPRMGVLFIGSHYLIDPVRKFL